MEIVEGKGESLDYLVVHPDGYDSQKGYPLVVLIHGFGASMRDLAPLSRSIERKGYVYACPNGPVEIPMAPGQVGYAWYPPRGSASEEDILAAEEQFKAFIQEVVEEYHTPPGQIILAGFSQGGAMALRLGLPDPTAFAAVVALSGAISDPQEMKGTLPTERTQPIFIAHGTLDAMVPVDRARQTRAFLEEEGYAPLYKEYSMGHEISQQLLDDLAPWMHEVMPPLAD